MEGQLFQESLVPWHHGCQLREGLACLFLRGIPVGTVVRKENVLLILFPMTTGAVFVVVYVTCFKHIMNLLSD